MALAALSRAHSARATVHRWQPIVFVSRDEAALDVTIAQTNRSKIEKVMRPLDLLLVSNVYPPEIHGGYELLADDCAQALRNRGHRVTVVTSGARAADDHPDVVRSLALSRSFATASKTDRLRHLTAAALNSRAVNKLLSQGRKFDGALVFSLRRLGLEPLRALMKREVKVAVTVNDDWPVAYAPRHPRSLLGRLAKRLADTGPLAKHQWGSMNCDRVLWLSEPLRQRVRSTGIRLGVGTVCSQGVNLSRWTPRAERTMDPLRPKLLFVGRLHPEKGAELAIEAVAELKRQGIHPLLRLVGAAVSTEYQATLEAHVARLGVQDLVEFCGAIDRATLPGVYGDADALLFISRSETEGQGLTWLESMAVGTPVIAHPSGGALAFFDAHGGVLRADHSSLAQCVVELGRSRELQRSLTAAGTNIVRTHASLDRYVDALLATLAQ